MAARYLSDYSAECLTAQSDFLDCAFNEYCLNTITFSSCPVSDCRYDDSALKPE